jgi:hypothetical protein
LTGPGQHTVILTCSLTKTNRENIKVKYNIGILQFYMEVLMAAGNFCLPTGH